MKEKERKQASGKRKNAKREISMEKYNFYSYILCGILHIIVAVCYLIAAYHFGEMSAAVIDTVAVAAVFVVLFIQIYVEKAKKTMDEMAQEDFYKAYRKTTDILDIIGVCLLGAVPTVVLVYMFASEPDVIRMVSAYLVIGYMQAIFFGFYGLQRLLTGIIFRKLENG